MKYILLIAPLRVERSQNLFYSSSQSKVRITYFKTGTSLLILSKSQSNNSVKQTQKMNATYKQEHERAQLDTTKVNCIGGNLTNACQTICYTLGNLSFCCV